MTKEQEITKYMMKLDISREEAEQMWEDDHSDEVLPEVAEMEKKAQKIKRYEKSDAPRKKSERVRKIDEVKVNIISTLAKLITGITKSENVTILKPEREITFTYKGDNYSITLTKHRPPKNQAVFFLCNLPIDKPSGPRSIVARRNFHYTTRWQFCQEKNEKNIFLFFPKNA